MKKSGDFAERLCGVGVPDGILTVYRREIRPRVRN